MSEIKKLVHQSSYYLVGSILMMAAGFISFPILTRILSVSDYGTLGLINTTLFLVIGFSKLGLQQSIVRFYSEFRSRKKESIFYSTMFLSSVSFSIIAGLIFYVIVHLLHNRFNFPWINLLFLVSILVITRCLATTLTSFVRAEQKAKLYNVISTATRYGSLALGILLMLFLFEGLYGFFLGHVIASIMTLAVLLYVYRQKSLLRIDLFSRSLLKDAMIFGFPMVCAELSHLVLNYADRYLIQFYLGSKSLGIYTAGYNLATYASETIAYTLSYARGPISMSILANKGRGELSKFLGTSFRYLILILIPLVFGFIAIGPDLISLLASEKYVEAHRILPYIIIAQAFYACSMTLNAGLFVSKKTHILSILLFFTCLLNVALNIVLIPRLEIIGAALATLLSFIIYTGFVAYFSFKELSFKVDWKNILSYSFAATGMYLILGLIDIDNLLFNVVVKIFVGIVSYSFFLVVFDSEMRILVAKIVGNLRQINEGSSHK